MIRRLIVVTAALLTLSCSHPGVAARTAQVTATVSITAYGASGDGSDDRAAIQAALTVGAGGMVTVPAGRYSIGRAGGAYFGLTVPAGTTLFCEPGAALVQLAGVAAAVRLLELDAPGATVIGCELAGVRDAQHPDTQKHGLFVRGAGATLRGLRIHDFPGDGVYLYPTGTGATLDSVVLESNGRNGVTDNANGATITGSTFRGNSAQQFDSEPGSPGHVDNVHITGSTFDGLGSSNDYVLTICGSTGGQSTGWGVTGNTINGGVYVVWAADIHLAGNTGLNPTSKPSLTAYRKVERLTVEGNAFTALAAEYGIAITGTGTGQAPVEVRIAGNTLTLGAGRYGIGISGALSVTLEDNVLAHPAGVGDTAISARATNPAAPVASVTLRGNRATGFSRGLGIGGMVENPAATIAALTASGNSLGGPWYLDEGSGALQAATLTDNGDAVTRWPAGAVVVTSSTTTMTRSP